MASFLQNATAGAQGLQNLEMNQLQLQQQQQQMQQQQRQQTQEDEGMQIIEQFKQGYQAGQPDYNLLITAAYKSPTAAKNILAGVGIVEENQKKQAASDIVTLTGSLDDPKSFYRATAQRIAAIKARGGDPSNTIEMAKRYQQGDIEGVKNELMVAGAALANEGYIKPELIGMSVEKPMTAYQQASTDLRQQELELNKQQKAADLQLKVLDAQMKKEGNQLKREDLQLKIQEQQQKLEELGKQRQNATQQKKADLNQAYFGIDNLLNTVARIKKSPELDSVIGSIEGRVDAYIDDEAAATIRLIDGLGAQAFMAMIPHLKGMGALSNAEGEKLGASLQNLSRVTSEKVFKENLSEVERLMNKSRKFISERFGAQESTPDIPAAQHTLGKPVNIGGYSVVEVQ